jgi:hypothetical protein
LMSTRLYFDLMSTNDAIPDREGVEVDDVHKAKAAVMATVDELRQEDAFAAQEWSGWTLNVSDDAGRVLFAIDLTLSERLRVARARSLTAEKRLRRVHGSGLIRLDAERQR